MSTLRVQCNEPSVADLYEEYSGRIFGCCLRRLPSREEAEDAVQHTFMNAFRGLQRGVVPRSESAWLFKIAENVCRERQRSAWRRSRLELVQDPDDMASLAAAPVRSHDELAGIADALAELPPNQQRAILLRDRKSTRLNSSHSQISYAVFCLKKKTKDVASVYEVPLVYALEGLDDEIVRLLHLAQTDRRMRDWEALVEREQHPIYEASFGVVG